MRVIGLDPGLTGAIASWDGTTLYVEEMPTIYTGKGLIVNIPELNEIVQYKMGGALKAWIERVSAMPKQGVSSMFKFGRVYGNCEAVLLCNNLPLEYVSPIKWKSEYGLKADKELARAKAIQLFPQFAGEFSRKKDHGKAEAALVAKYGFIMETKGDINAEDLNS